MKLHFQTAFSVTAAAVFAVTLSGCQSLTAPRLASIPAAGYTVMGAENIAARSALVIAPSSLPRDISYTPFRCGYRATVKLIGQSENASQPRVVATRARDRLLVTIRDGANVSTALLGPDGQLFDFNLASFLGAQHVTADTYAAATTAAVAQMEQQQGRRVHMINDFALVFPRYMNRRPAVGDVASELVDETNNPWGRYVFRGLAPYAGGQVAVFDLVVDAPPSGTPVIVGYNLVDPTTMAPVLVIFDSSSRLRFERISCP